METIFALSSGSPPAGIAVVRVSGPNSGAALVALTRKKLADPRIAVLAILFNPSDGTPLDRALTLWFPGPSSVTGEDVVELHLHGGRAVVAAVLNTLSQLEGLRQAEPGEFTRRAFENGRIDLAEAEGLADLLSAETEAQRRSAIAQVGGSLHRLTEGWTRQLLKISARVEAAIDFSDEDDVADTVVSQIDAEVLSIVASIKEKIDNPPAERLKYGLRVAVLGPPNSGKSTLLNRLISREAAIVSDIPGTTRDVIEAHVTLGGVPLIFIDTAGIRHDASDPIEQIGISRSYSEGRVADIILALGGWHDPETTALVLDVTTKGDLIDGEHSGLTVSAHTGQGMAELLEAINAAAASCLPPPDQVALALRHRIALGKACAALTVIAGEEDELIVAEQVRIALLAVGEVTGGTDAEDMLDILFGSFCIGK
ncbi:MAG: mnmE [Sphingomonadales bacterium]|nr:mnmE [Sphingomonadales bacterium]